MAEMTLESLAKRVEALEQALASGRQAKDWRKTIGMFGGNDFMREVDEECARTREKEREAARRGEFAE